MCKKINNKIVTILRKSISGSSNFNLETIVLFFVLAFFAGSNAEAQLSKYLFGLEPETNLYTIKDSVDVYMQNLMNTVDSATFYAEGGEYMEYRKFLDFWEPRLHPHGNFEVYFTADSVFYASTRNDYDYVTNEPWHEIGPTYEPQGVGPTEFITFYDCGNNDSTNFMLTGATLGGLFYSTDGGENWNKTGTDTQWERSGCGWAVFHPENHKVWFASSSGNNSGISGFIGKTGGIYRTIDEGTHWTQIANVSDLPGGEWTTIIKLVIDPNEPDILYAVTSHGVLKTENCNDNDPEWDWIHQEVSFDLELKPGLSSTLYLSTFDEQWKIMVSTDSGENWIDFPYQPYFVNTNNIYSDNFTIEVSKAQPEFLYCSVQVGGIGYLFYYDLSNPGPWIPINPNQTIESKYGHGHGFGVEQVTSGDNILVSSGTGMKKFSISNGYLGSIVPHHVDVEDINYHPYIQNEVWSCTHGGVEKSINLGNTNTWVEKYSGLGVANVERMATSFTNPEYVLVGLYHDGSQITRSTYEQNWNPVWNWVFGGDGMRPLIDNVNPTNMWVSGQDGSWAYSDNFLNSYPLNIYKRCYFNTEGVLNKLTTSTIFRKAYYDTNPFRNEEVYRSTNRGLNQNEFISEFRDEGYVNYNILKLLTTFTNEDYLMVLIREEEIPNQTRGEALHIFLTKNANDDPGNVVWTELDFPEQLWIGTIFFDPKDENIVYMANFRPYDENDYHLVYKVDYTNMSVPVYENLTGNLPFVMIGSDGADGLVVENGNSGGIYLSTDFGVFYTNNQLINGSEVEWQLCGTEIPNVVGRGLEINYFCNKLRLGTWGRGVWEINLPCLHESTPLEINENTTWNDFNRLDRSIVVKQGYCLTIDHMDRIMIPEDGKIIVEPGAKLVIDGGIITNGCEMPWQGIEVWGNPSLSQIPANQGWLEIINGGTIENAEVAVRAGSADYTGKGG